jgi:predicted dehydrogenase
MKVAIIGAGHWHVPSYVKALQSLGVELVGISDWSEAALERVGAQVDCPRYRCFQDLLDEQKPEFVFAHAMHDEMTHLAGVLVGRHQPFHMEKPMGLDWKALEPVAVKAETEKLFVSVPLVSRYYAPVEKLREMRLAGSLGKPVHYHYRLFAGSPNRYLDLNVEWMLDPKHSGAGPLFNFGPHVIDLYLYLLEEAVTEVFARQTSSMYGLQIEDLTAVTMVGKSGTIGTVEVSYTLPAGHETFLSVTTDKLHYAGTASEGVLKAASGETTPLRGLTMDEAYAHYTADTLARFAAGDAPKASIGEMAAILRVMNAAQESLRTGKAVKLRADEEEE